MIGLLCFVLAAVASAFKSKLRLEAENAVLRHQLMVLRRRVRGRVRLTNNDRWFFVQLYRWFRSIRQVLTIIPGPVTADRLCRLAAQLKMYLVAGVAERDRDAIYNSACLIGPEGLVAVYRKTHLMDSERAWASFGDAWVVADTPVGRIGLLIGHDASFPEAGRILALRGADLIVCPAATKERFSTPHPGSSVPQNYPIPTGADPYHWHHFRVRAGENNVFFAFSNVFDPANGYPGLSGVFGPDSFEFPRREAIAADTEGATTAVVDTTNLDTVYPTNVVRRKDLVAMRMPHGYRALITKAAD